MEIAKNKIKIRSHITTIRYDYIFRQFFLTLAKTSIEKIEKPPVQSTNQMRFDTGKRWMTGKDRETLLVIEKRNIIVMPIIRCSFRSESKMTSDSCRYHRDSHMTAVKIPFFLYASTVHPCIACTALGPLFYRRFSHRFIYS